MKINNQSIQSATEAELWTLWYESELCEIMPFGEYKQKMRKLGVKILCERDTNTEVRDPNEND